MGELTLHQFNIFAGLGNITIFIDENGLNARYLFHQSKAFFFAQSQAAGADSVTIGRASLLAYYGYRKQIGINRIPRFAV